jgi:hypothetical protein
VKPGTFIHSLNKHGAIIIFLAWMISVGTNLYFWGFNTTMEAEKYIREARHFIEYGGFSAPRYWFYSVTTFIIAFSLKIHAGLWGAFAIQALINLFAYLLLYKALKKILRYPFTALVIIIYLLGFWPYQSWVVYLYTESMFFSSILILFSSLVLHDHSKKFHLLFIGLALLMTIFSRPLGILFAASAYVYLFAAATRKWKFAMAIGSVAVLVVAVFIINTIFRSISDWQITQAFEEESIICGIPMVTENMNLKLAAGGSPVSKLFYYITHNTAHFFRFTGIKLRYFFLMTRDYYSNSHNYFLLLNVIPLYLLGFFAFFLPKRNETKRWMVFAWTTILLFTLTVIFQCDDYHNRFVLAIFPFFVLLAAFTIEFLVTRFQRSNPMIKA